jgi:hypothetical protein
VLVETEIAHENDTTNVTDAPESIHSELQEAESELIAKGSDINGIDDPSDQDARRNEIEKDIELVQHFNKTLFLSRDELNRLLDPNLKFLLPKLNEIVNSNAQECKAKLKMD